MALPHPLEYYLSMIRKQYLMTQRRPAKPRNQPPPPPQSPQPTQWGSGVAVSVPPPQPTPPPAPVGAGVGGVIVNLPITNPSPRAGGGLGRPRITAPPPIQPPIIVLPLPPGTQQWVLNILRRSGGRVLVITPLGGVVINQP